jgi:diguanylate cyclase (GGDEF)-like protein
MPRTPDPEPFVGFSWPEDPEVRADAPLTTQLRLAVAKHDAPRTLTWAGCLVVGFSALGYLFDRTGGFLVHSFDIAVGVLFVIAGMALRRPRVPASIVPPVFAALMTLLVLAFLAEIWISPSELAMAYVLLVLCAFGPPTLDWRPFLAAAAVMVGASCLVSISWAGSAWLNWTLASIAAVVISGVLLRVRLRSVIALADATALAQRLATVDELTGMLNRHGLARHLPPITAMSRRLDQPVFVAFVDIDGLKAANDTHGHAFGDQVIRTVAQAVVDCVRENDLVARWGGDELVVVGLGLAPDPATFTTRIRDKVVASGLDLTQWPGHVSIGKADGRPDEDGIDRLINLADEDMYRRRQSR